jgi:hypothetical protein
MLLKQVSPQLRIGFFPASQQKQQQHKLEQGRRVSL